MNHLDIIGQQQDSTWSYYGYDGLGSVRQVYDSLGAVGYTTSYAPYGTAFESYGDLTTSLGFTGEYTDASGLLYLRARYLNTDLGMFLSRDPFEGVMDQVITRNAYNYVGANPINYTDSSGEFWGSGMVLLGGILGGMAGAVAANLLFNMAKRGDCGCELKAWANQPGQRTDFVKKAIGMGIAMGAYMGGMASLDPLATSIAGFYMSSAGALAAAMKPGGLSNPCNALEYILGLGGMALSSMGAMQALSQTAKPSYARPNSDKIRQEPIEPTRKPQPPRALPSGKVVEQPSAGAMTQGAANEYKFIGTPSGQTVRVPKDWGFRIADNGKGSVYQRPGAVKNADSIRIMDPTARYPNGYVRYYNKHGQPLNPMTGNSGTEAETHLALPYYGPLVGYP